MCGCEQGSALQPCVPGSFLPVLAVLFSSIKGITSPANFARLKMALFTEAGTQQESFGLHSFVRLLCSVRSVLKIACEMEEKVRA